jgi:threonine/homoserine/homoserine lactone efflux protein
MPDFLHLSQLWLFVFACFTLLIVPGPSVLYIVARGIDQGRLAALVSVLGISVGTLCHTVAAALGVSALVVTSTLAFQILKYLGAAYLIYLGIRKLLVSDKVALIQVNPSRSLKRIFWQGILVNVLNPKTTLFFFAFLPQFVDPSQPAVPLQILLLGLILMIMGLINDCFYAVLSGSIGYWLSNHAQVFQKLRYLTGSIYISLGMTTALVEAPD